MMLIRRKRKNTKMFVEERKRTLVRAGQFVEGKGRAEFSKRFSGDLLNVSTHRVIVVLQGGHDFVRKYILIYNFVKLQKNVF